MGIQSVVQPAESEAAGLEVELEEVFSLTSLVPSETNEHPLKNQSQAQRCIHHAVEKFRKSIIEALWDSGDEGLLKRAQKMGLCCVAPMIFADEKSQPICVAGYCRDRLCPTCMRRRAAKVRARLRGLVGSMNSPRFCTFTQRDHAGDLASVVDEMTSALKTLRRTSVWKRHVKGGVMVWEVTRNEAKKTWHVHMHLIFDGVFFPHALLHGEWTRILGHDGTCKLEAIHDRSGCARYLGKYLAKDCDLAGWSDASIIEFAKTMHRRRLIATFGTMHSVNVDLCDEEKEKPQLPKASLSYGQVRDAIAAGIEPARRAAPLLAQLGIAFRQLFFEFSQPGDAYADEVAASLMSEFGGWIEDIHAQLMTPAEEISIPPPSDFRGQLSLHGRSTEYR